LKAGARTLGLDVQVVRASTDGDLDSAFATLTRVRAGGLVIAPDQFLYARSEKIAALAIQHAVPTIFQYRQSAVAGGLMSYGANGIDLFHLAGAYTGRVLKGEKPADLPIVQSTRFEFVINLKTAKALGLEIPPMVLTRADEVIE
jgi:putative ABC transport system substrate-binding protein